MTRPTDPSCSLFCLVVMFALPGLAHAETAPINAVVGDISWVQFTGHLPTEEEARTRDEERHRVHLAWIERQLRAAVHPSLTDAQRARRGVLLDALAHYRQRGEHPVNERTTRRPRFLDEDGRICAVGYLIEVSAGREAVERINRLWEYDWLLSIDDPELERWAKESGFTLQELASIQPTGAPAIGFDFSLSDETQADLLIGSLAGLVFAIDVGLITALTMADRHESEQSRARLAMTQLAVGILQLTGSVVLGGATFADAFEERLTGPLVATSLGFSALSLIQIGYAASCC